MKKKIITMMLAAAMLISMLGSCTITIGKSSSGDTGSSADTSSVGDTSNEDVSSEAVSSNSSSSVNGSDVEISNELFSFQIGIDGHVYSIPCALSEFEANGWTIYGEDGTIEPKHYVLSERIKKGDKYFWVKIYNPTSTNINYSDGLITYVSVTLFECMSPVLPGNLVFDESVTKEDIIAKYGEPTHSSETEETYYLYYQYPTDPYKDIVFSISKPNGEFPPSYNSVSVENFGDR